jgi:microcystin-dependent protein
MATTARGFHYPLTGASPDVPADIQALATDVDGQFITTSPRPAASKSGRHHYNAATGEFSLDIGSAWVTVGWASIRPSSEDSPIGSGRLWFAAVAPTGWVLADGSLLARVGQYAPLFNVISTTFNLAGDADATKFRLPDLRGRVPMGADGAAGRLTSSPDTLGTSGGAEAAALTSGQLPVHRHSLMSGDVTVALGGQGLRVPVRGSTGNVYTDVAGDVQSTSGAQPLISNTGSSDPVSNMQPYQVVNYIIKY